MSRINLIVSIFITMAMVACEGPSEIGPDAAPGATCETAPARKQGEATFYAADGSGNCSFEAGGDLMVAAMNNTDYGNADLCGSCIEVTGPKGRVVVKVVDRCPECSPGDLDLSKEAFTKIADQDAGRVQISWQQVACETSGPMQFHFKADANRNYTPVQIRNHRYPIAAVEVRDAQGSWHVLTRKLYNYFVPASGLGAGPYEFRVTDTRGQTVSSSEVELTPGADSPGDGQFGICEG